jgi:hypothetical protein
VYSSSILLRSRVCAIAFALFLVPGSAAFAQATTPTTAQPPAQDLRVELERLRKEFEAIRDSYGQRLAALEQKLATAGAPTSPPAGQPAAAQPTVAPPTPVTAPAGGQPPEAQVPAGAAGAGGPQGALPVYGNPSALSKIFNPDIAVVGNFLGATGKNPINPAPVFDMNEAEATFQAVVDPYARADFFFAIGSEGIEIEEGFLTFPTLPGGLLAKVGKMKQQVGKANTFHAHNLPWIDRPLANVNLLGGEEGLADAGISVSRLVMNPWIFLEATGEVYQGNSGVFQSHERSDISWVTRLRGYRDLGESTNVDIGASYARGGNDVGPDFNTGVFALDATFRYRPLKRAVYRRFLGRTELFWSRREQEDGTVPAFGMYASGEYQFARRWFSGVRYDRSQRAFDASLRDTGAALTLTYWPSEFSQVRSQYRRINFAEGVKANEVFFQFIFSIGAHGAHGF